MFWEQLHGAAASEPASSCCRQQQQQQQHLSAPSLLHQLEVVTTRRQTPSTLSQVTQEIQTATQRCCGGAWSVFLSLFKKKKKVFKEFSQWHKQHHEEHYTPQPINKHYLTVAFQITLILLCVYLILFCSQGVRAGGTVNFIVL